MITTAWKRIVRFVSLEDGHTYIGEPVDETLDVGAALADGRRVTVRVFTGTSVLDVTAAATETVRTIGQLLAPVTWQEAGAVRCIGLNYRQHAREMGLALPAHPTVFLKPARCVQGGNSALVIPALATDGEADYEAELAVVLGRAARDVAAADAADYILGYTAANDVTARTQQMRGAQWSFGKGFDGFAPLGPCLVAAHGVDTAAEGAGRLEVRALLNGETMQQGRVDDMIFGIAEIVAYLSQGTTLDAGTVILTGTPHGIGAGRQPPVFLRPGDDVRIVASHSIGSLVNVVEYERAGPRSSTSSGNVNGKVQGKVRGKVNGLSSAGS